MKLVVELWGFGVEATKDEIHFGGGFDLLRERVIVFFLLVI